MIRNLMTSQSETEGRTLAQSLRFDPDPAAMHLDDAPHQGQPDARALLVRVQALEEAEDPLLVLRRNTAAVVAHMADDDSVVRAWANADLEARRDQIYAQLRGESGESLGDGVFRQGGAAALSGRRAVPRLGFSRPGRRGRRPAGRRPWCLPGP